MTTMQIVEKQEPLYIKLASFLRKRIQDGLYKNGFPTHRAIAREAQVSRKTVELAIQMLEKEGLLTCVGGKGTFIQQPEIFRLSKNLGDDSHRPVVENTIYLMTPVDYENYLQRESGPQFHEIFQGMLCEAAKRKLNVQVTALPKNLEISNLDDFFSKKSIPKGYAFIIDPDKCEPYLHAVGKLAPYIVFGYTPGFDIKTNSIRTDDEKGTFLAVEHLVSLGHRRIGYIAPINFFEDNSWYTGRKKGYELALKVFDIPFDQSIIKTIGGGDSVQRGYIGAKELLSNDKSISAIMTSNDLAAVGVIKAANELGLKVPENISVIGFDDMIQCQYHTPQLTTVRINHFQSGKIAVQILDDLFHSKLKSPIKKILSSELITRQTCAPAKLRKN